MQSITDRASTGVLTPTSGNAARRRRGMLVAPVSHRSQQLLLQLHMVAG